MQHVQRRGAGVELLRAVPLAVTLVGLQRTPVAARKALEGEGKMSIGSTCYIEAIVQKGLLHRQRVKAMLHSLSLIGKSLEVFEGEEITSGNPKASVDSLSAVIPHHTALKCRLRVDPVNITIRVQEIHSRSPKGIKNRFHRLQKDNICVRKKYLVDADKEGREFSE